MTFARLVSAFVVLPFTLTPLAWVLRYGFGYARPENAGLATPFDVAIYGGALLVLYGALTAVFWLVRTVAVAVDRWESNGLEALDYGLHWGWPRRWALLIGFGAVAAGFWAGVGLPRIAEIVTSALIVTFAVGGATPPLRPVDDFDPLPLPLPPPDLPSPEAGETIALKLWWYFHQDPGAISASANFYELTLLASKDRYERLAGLDHTVRADDDYVRFVREGFSPELLEAAARIRSLSEQGNLGTIGEINNILAFAQQFAYEHDQNAKGVAEYPRFPLETLVDQAGDCEDHAILAAACLATLGYDTRLVAVSYPEGPGHMALAVAAPDDLPGVSLLQDPTAGTRFYYCEVSTNAVSRHPDRVAFRMGEVPPDDRRSTMKLLRIQ